MLRERISSHEICSTIFININASQLGSPRDEEVLEGLQVAFLAIYAPLRHFGGVLRQFLKDDKGFVAILIFTGCESNAVSACRCALKIKENFHQNEIASSFGIASGKVFFGPVGDHRRCEFAWIGDSINLSARLMSKSLEVEEASPIFVDKTTADNAGSELYFELHGLVKLKVRGRGGEARGFIKSDDETSRRGEVTRRISSGEERSDKLRGAAKWSLSDEPEEIIVHYAALVAACILLYSS